MRPLRNSDAQALGAVLGRRKQVLEVLVAEKNRPGRAAPEVRQRIEAPIGWLRVERLPAAGTS